MDRSLGEFQQKMKKFLAFACVAGMWLSTLNAQAADDKTTIANRVESARVVLTEIMATPDQSIPNQIMKQATCVSVFPSVKKGAFLVGAEYGQGVVTCRTSRGWSAPAFIRIAGGSFGFQLGAQAIDLVLVAVNQRGFQDLLKNKFKLGGDASAAAGPVGRDSQASTDWKMGAELLTYSRAKGLFAGIDLNGAVVDQNLDATRTFYGVAYPFEQLLKGEVATPPQAQPFVRTTAKYFTSVQ
jgi:lipid-binding SYLF domain-containing protein